MKTISKISSILMLFTFAFASDAKTGVIESAENIKNVAPVKQLIKSELVSTNEIIPIDIEQMKKFRAEKSIRDRKYSDAVLKNIQSSEKEQKKSLESAVRKSNNKDILKRWANDIRSKLSVTTLKRENVKKITKLPSTPKTN